MAQPASQLTSPRIQAALYFWRKRLRNRRQDARTDPALTVAPAITGTPTVAQELTADPGTWEGAPVFTYQWLRDSEPIAGARESTYTLIEADEDALISVSVVARNATGFASATSDTVGPVEGAV